MDSSFSTQLSLRPRQLLGFTLTHASGFHADLGFARPRSSTSVLQKTEHRRQQLREETEAPAAADPAPSVLWSTTGPVPLNDEILSSTWSPNT